MSAESEFRRVVITGRGAVTPLGSSAQATWAGLIEGRSGVRQIPYLPVETYPVQIAGVVTDFQPESALPEGTDCSVLSRQAQFALAASWEAMKDANLLDDDNRLVGGVESSRCGVALGATAGRPELEELTEMFYRIKEGKELLRQPLDAVERRDQNTALRTIARKFALQGPVFSVSTACTASGHALGEAFRTIQTGRCDVVLAGGSDSLLSWLDLLGFSLLGALSTSHQDEPALASRPFSADRDGFVLGEGSVMFVLEDLESARRRGATILGEITGYASTLNAYRMTDPPPRGGGVTLAISKALDESGRKPDEIGYIAAHGTSTPGNDVSETTAIKDVFGDAAGQVAVSSAKSMVGHLTAAAAGVGMLCALGVLREHVAPPTINLNNPDPALDLNFVPNSSQIVNTDAALVNAFAFGGTNACLVVEKLGPGHSNRELDRS